MVACRLLVFGLFVVSQGCAHSPRPEPPPVLKPQVELEVVRLLPGVWKLQTVDGEPATGWLLFSDNERGRLLTFSMICGSQDGSYKLQGHTVSPALGTSVSRNCSQEEIARSTIRVPALLDRPFQVNVDAHQLIARGRSRTGSAWARYVRSSPNEMMNEARRQQKSQP